MKKIFLVLITLLIVTFIVGCANKPMTKTELEITNDIGDEYSIGVVEFIEVVNRTAINDTWKYEVKVQIRSQFTRYNRILNVYYDESGKFKEIEETKKEEWTAIPIDTNITFGGSKEKLANHIFETSANGGCVLKSDVQNRWFYNWNMYSDNNDATEFISNLFSRNASQTQSCTTYTVAVSSDYLTLTEDIEVLWKYADLSPEKEYDQDAVLIPQSIKSVSHSVNMDKNIIKEYMNGADILTIDTFDNGGFITGTFNGNVVMWKITGLHVMEPYGNDIGKLFLNDDGTIRLETVDGIFTVVQTSENDVAKKDEETTSTTATTTPTVARFVKLEDMTSINENPYSSWIMTDNYGNIYESAIIKDSSSYYDQIEYLLNYKYKNLTGTLYVPEGEKSEYSTYMKVIADGVEIYKSPNITKTSYPVDIDIDVSNYNNIKIEFYQNGEYPRLKLCFENAGFHKK